MTEIFRTNFAARLSSAITAVATSMTLTSVPVSLEPGTYRFRLGTSQRTSEWLSGDYPGFGTTFTSLARAAEGGNPALAWPAGTPVSHVLTGQSITSFVNLVPQRLAHEEFSPAVAAVSVGLSHNPAVLLTVARNGLVQSVVAGHYSLSGATVTFADVFVASERVVIAYSYLADETLLGTGPVGVQSVALPPATAARARDYSFSHTHQNTI